MKCSRRDCGNVIKRQGLCASHYAVVPSGYVDAEPALERYRLLRRRGLTVDQIARLSGLHRDTLRLMGTWGQGGVCRETHDLLMAVRVPTKVVASKVCVPAIGTHRRIQALAVAGHSLAFIGAELGITQQAVSSLLRRDVVWADSAVKIAELFDRLQMIPGPSSRARRWALRRGWAPAFAFDDLDDPAEQPASSVEASVTWLEKYTELRDLGIPESRIPERMGVEPKSVERQLMRLGITKGAA